MPGRTARARNSPATTRAARTTTTISSTHGQRLRFGGCGWSPPGITSVGCSSDGSGYGRVGCSSLMVLHPLGGRDSEQIEAVAKHLTGGVVQPQPRAVHALDRIVAERGDAA